MSLTTASTRKSRGESAVVPPVVRIDQVSKAFRLPHQRYNTLKERVLHPFRSSTYDILQAVDAVSVEIMPGEFFGIVGRNGSGKSTLLKCVAGIYKIDRGELTVRGRLSPFIELGVGFNMELTARDNVMINAIMLGLTTKQARASFDEIIAFAELEDFLDLRLKNYSSGMHVRLAFSVAIQVEAEILLIDEVLAVGDAAFQQKCFDEFERMKRAGRTILFVTHDMGAIERFCDRAMLLEKGQTAMIGKPTDVARRYNALNFGSTIHQGSAKLPSEATVSPVSIIDGWFENRDGARIAALASDEPLRVCMEVRFNESLDDPIFGFTLRNEVGITILATSTDHGYGSTGRFTCGEVTIVRLSFENYLTPSRHLLTPSIARRGVPADALDLREDIASVVIHGGRFTGGVVDLPHVFEISPR